MLLLCVFRVEDGVGPDRPAIIVVGVVDQVFHCVVTAENEALQLQEEHGGLVDTRDASLARLKIAGQESGAGEECI